MPKTKGDILIGKRTREEVDRIFPSFTVAALALNCDRKCFTMWSHGLTPETMKIAKIHYYGGDVLYILTGKKSVT